MKEICKRIYSIKMMVYHDSTSMYRLATVLMKQCAKQKARCPSFSPVHSKAESEAVNTKVAYLICC